MTAKYNPNHKEILSIPFEVPSALLPTPLPTISEIQSVAASDVLLECANHRTIARIRPYLIKWGPGVLLSEGQNMLFLRLALSPSQVYIPQIYALYSEPDGSQKGRINHFIVMEYICDAKTMEDEWSIMSYDEKSGLMTILEGFWDRLREVKPVRWSGNEEPMDCSSPMYYGSLNKKKLEDNLFWTWESKPEMNGPFENEEQVNQALAMKFAFGKTIPHRSEFYRQTLPKVLVGHEPVLTHGDLQRKNILIIRNHDSSKSTSGSSHGALEKLVLIDWEFAGWYPSYWEFSSAMFCANRHKDDWNLWLQKFLQSYWQEYAWIEMLRRDSDLDKGPGDGNSAGKDRVEHESKTAEVLED